MADFRTMLEHYRLIADLLEQLNTPVRKQRPPVERRKPKQ